MRVLILLLMVFFACSVCASAAANPFEGGVLISDQVFESDAMLQGEMVRRVGGEPERLRVVLKLSDYPVRAGRPFSIRVLLLSESFETRADPAKLFYSSDERLLEGAELFTLGLLGENGGFRVPSPPAQFEAYRGVASQVNDARRFPASMGRPTRVESLLAGLQAVEPGYEAVAGTPGLFTRRLEPASLSALGVAEQKELEQRYFDFEGSYDRLELPVYWQSHRVAGFAIEIPLEVKSLQDPIYLLLGPLQVGRGGVSVATRSQGSRYFKPLALRIMPSELRPYLPPAAEPKPAPAKVSMFRADPAGTGVFEGPPLEKLMQKGWKFKTGEGISASAAITKGSVYVSSQDGYLYALDKAGGRERWKLHIGGQNNSSPAVAESLVYAGSETGVLHAVDAESGRTRWELRTGGAIASSPLVAQGRVYVGSQDGYLYALDALTGRQGWRFKTDAGIRSSPVYAAGRIYFGSEDGNLYAVSAENGEHLWHFQTAGYVDSSPAVAGNLVYVGSIDTHLYALDALTGRERWRVRLGDWVESSPVVAEGMVFVGCEDGFLYAIDAASGDRLWSVRVGRAVRGAPSVSGGIVYVGSEEGRLLALAADSGERLWSFETGSWIRSAPVVENRVAYFGTGDGYFYALQ